MSYSITSFIDIKSQRAELFFSFYPRRKTYVQLLVAGFEVDIQDLYKI